MLGGRFASAETVTLNLVDAEIRTVIATISEATGKNFLVDPRVKGKVTVISSLPLDSDALYDVFLSILEVHGYAAIENDGIVKIVPQNMAKQSSIPIETDSSNYDGAQKITKVLRLKHVSAAKLIPVLRPLVPKEGHMAAYIPANALIISDSAANIARLGRIVESIDKPTNSSIEVVQLKKASATKVVQLLKSLQTGKEKGAAAVLAVADERTNSVLLSGDPAKRVLMRSIIQQLDEPIEVKSNDRVVYLNHAIAKDMAPILDKTINAKIKQANRKAGVTVVPANIQADEATNSLIISASPDQHKTLLAIIEKLDIRRAQVMVEAIIVDLDATKARDLGVQMAGTGKHGSFVSRSSNTGTSINGALSSAVAALPIVGDGLTFLGASENFALMFKALESDADTNILSTPSLFTLDNNEAEIVVGKNVPFVTGSFTDSGTDATNPFQTIEREDVGLTLRIKPHINEGDVVTMEISIEVSSLSPSVEGASDLVTNKRLITTTVVIDDGEIVSLGGLIDDRVTESVSGIPYLSKIPYVGALFRSTSTEISKRMMMVFFRPSIIRDQEGSQAILESNYREIRNRQIERKKSDPTRDPEFEYPLLPALELITPESGKQYNYQKLRRQQDEKAAPAPAAETEAEPESGSEPELDTAESAAQ